MNIEIDMPCHILLMPESICIFKLGICESIMTMPLSYILIRQSMVSHTIARSVYGFSCHHDHDQDGVG
jgi:hypothetical protein